MSITSIGINTDNRVENLRYLCPNCHSQTETFGSKNSNERDVFFCQPIVTSIPKKLTFRSTCSVCFRPHNNKVFCSYTCQAKGQGKLKLTDQEIYDRWIANNKNYLKTSRELGISDNGVRKRIEKFMRS
jgi:hypothetical protein